MTVKELIEALQKMPPDAKVEVWRRGEPIDDESAAPLQPELDKGGVVQI